MLIEALGLFHTRITLYCVFPCSAIWQPIHFPGLQNVLDDTKSSARIKLHVTAKLCDPVPANAVHSAFGVSITMYWHLQQIVQAVCFNLAAGTHMECTVFWCGLTLSFLLLNISSSQNCRAYIACPTQFCSQGISVLHHNTCYTPQKAGLKNNMPVLRHFTQTPITSKSSTEV